MELVDRVRRTIAQYQLAGPQTRVVAALSGGSDSVALVNLLAELARAGDLQLVGLAHFNHRLRSAADDDERFCHRVAASLGVPLVVDREDVSGLARREHRSVEDAARTARHAFFERARVQLGADAVALGHTKDDQAETFVLRLLRGAGAKGLASMHPRAGAVVRPLLAIRREELRRYLDDRRLDYVSDETNQDVAIPRNRIRAELLPLIARRFNPSIVDVLANEADLAREQYWYFEAEADKWESRFRRRRGRQIFLDAAALADVHVAVARTVLQRAMSQVSGRTAGFDAVNRALHLARTGGGSFDGPGQRVQRIGSEIVLTGRSTGNVVGRRGRPSRSANLFQYSLSIPGEVHLVEAGCVVSAEVAGTRGDVTAASDGVGVAVAVVQLDKTTDHLSVRNRRPGDRFRPLGLGGGKKLQDFFVDRKVARERRDIVPIVVDAADRIVWVAGHSIDEAFRVTDPAQAVIILRLMGVGGSA